MIVREYLGTSDYAGTVQFRLDENTAYSVEELLGMVLAHAKQQAEDFTEQKIKVK